MDSSQSFQHENIQATLYFLDKRLIPKGKYVCDIWKESETGHSTGTETELQDLRLMQVNNPSSGSKFFACHDFLNLHKLELTTGVFRQEELLTFSQNFISNVPSLKCLTIDLKFPSVSRMFPIAQEKLLHKNAGKNLLKILTVLDSPALSSFHFRTNEDPYRHSNWEFEVFQFLKTKSKLKVLDLTLGNKLQRRKKKPSISGLHPLAPLEVMLIQYQPNTHFYSATVPRSYFWTALLNQCNLKIVDLMSVPNITIRDLEFLIRKNESSLKVLRFQQLVCGVERKCKFNCDALRQCLALQHFTFNPGLCNEFPRRPISTMSNFKLLPTTLTSLSISNVNINTTVLKSLKDLKKLRVLQLIHCGAKEGRGVSVHALLELFRLRKLHKLVVAPVLIANKADDIKLTAVEKTLKAADRKFQFLRHILHPIPLPKAENIGSYAHFCPIA